jgi:hypothetical protein
MKLDHSGVAPAPSDSYGHEACYPKRLALSVVCLESRSLLRQHPRSASGLVLCLGHTVVPV